MLPTGSVLRQCLAMVYLCYVLQDQGQWVR
jgi:hypothetical protein